VALIYKILSMGEWEKARKQGVFKGSAVDQADGFIHFSSRAQVRGTAARHFSGARDLVILSVEESELGPALKWEVSRGGALFPHLYGDLQMSLVTSANPLPWVDGRHQFPEAIP
jgi:uncharacterized protein (DUF952 family)